MSHTMKFLTDGAIRSLFVSQWHFLTQRVNPRIFLQDYPPEIQVKEPPNTKAKRRLTSIFGISFMLLILLKPFFSTILLTTGHEVQFWTLWLNAAEVILVFNVLDWVILDWLMFYTITPRLIAIPDSKGLAPSKDYSFHFRGFFHGLICSNPGSLNIAEAVSFF